MLENICTIQQRKHVEKVQSCMRNKIGAKGILENPDYSLFILPIAIMQQFLVPYVPEPKLEGRGGKRREGERESPCYYSLLLSHFYSRLLYPGTLFTHERRYVWSLVKLLSQESENLYFL